MRVALIGANGQLGTDLVKTCPDFVELIPLTIEQLDITNKEQVFEVLSEHKPDLILNTAAYVNVEKAEEEADKAFFVNAYGVKNLVDYCRDRSCALLHVSTDYVFDGTKHGVPYYEDDVPNPINVYGNSKLAGEFIVKNYLGAYYLVRSSSLYGVAGAQGKGGNFPYAIIKKAKAGETLRVVEDIYMVPTHTLDLSEALWKLITERLPYGTYHITHTGYCSWYEFAKKILELLSLEAEVVPVKHYEYPTKARRPLWSVLSTTKGIKLSPWEEGLKRFLEAAKEAGKI